LPTGVVIAGPSHRTAIPFASRTITCVHPVFAGVATLLIAKLTVPVDAAVKVCA
jgi:hypothetical protein